MNMEIENKIYSIAEMRELAIFTADYCFMDAPCTVVGTLLLKAQARRKMFRLFFRLEDESKIIIRVIESEKRKMEKSARLRGLTLSAYLRKLGLGREVQAISPPDFYEAYQLLKALRERWNTLPKTDSGRPPAFAGQWERLLYRNAQDQERLLGNPHE
jgi:hypothetical protein